MKGSLRVEIQNGPATVVCGVGLTTEQAVEEVCAYLPVVPIAEYGQYRQAALELQAEIRHALAWAATGAERSVGDAMLLKTADKWLSLLDD